MLRHEASVPLAADASCLSMIGNSRLLQTKSISTLVGFRNARKCSTQNSKAQILAKAYKIFQIPLAKVSVAQLTSVDDLQNAIKLSLLPFRFLNLKQSKILFVCQEK